MNEPECQTTRCRRSTVIALLTLLVSLASIPSATAAYGFRKAITIDNTKVGGSSSLTNFQILVSLTDLDLRTTANGGKVESVNGFDIVFKQGCTTTNLDHEIEQYDPVTGTLVAWVRAPVLFHDTDTLIEMYYGDSAIVSSQENVAGVWDTNYIGVWHLNQPSGAGAYVTNSAQNDHHGTPTNTTFNATGQIDGARTFVGSGDERIDWGNSSSFFDGWNQFAFEFWIFPDYASDAAWEGAAEDGVMSSSSGTAPVRLARVRRGGGEPAGKGTFQADVEFVGAGTQFQTVEISRGQWNHIVYLYDGTDLKKFVNGVSVGSVSLPGDTLVSSSSIGLRLGWTSNALNGSLDEVRISNSGRGDGWIQTEYNNQSSPATFYTVGPELTGAVCITNYRSIGTAADETAGTATATNGSKVVTGSGTAWRTNNRGIGDQIDLGGADYTILSVDSDTKLTLTEPFSGAYSGAYTIARQFTTIPQWENCISLAGCPGGYPFPPATASLVADNRTERGIAYNDSVFSVGATINGSTTDATHNITLTVATGNRHNGTAGSGVALDGGGTIQTLLIRDDYTRLEWFEFRNCKGADGNVVSAGAQNVLVSHLIVHDFDDPVFTNIDGISIQSSAGVFSLAVRNSIVYDGENSCVQADGADDTLTVENSTLYGCRRGVYEDAGSTINVRNTIAMANSTADFAVSVGTQSNNLSQDATAPGVGSLTLRAPANQFVSLTSGAEDFHLVTSADALDAGTPLSDVVVDIDLQTRPSGVQWDMGADERPGAGALGCPVVQQAWFDADWSFRKAIVIDSAQVAASLTGFPVLIHLATDPELAGAAQVNGDDIVFTASDGVTKLSHEIELFVKATGELVVWVNVPYLSGGADTTIYMYYRSTVPGSQEDVAGVWDASYGGVWHLDENPDDPAPQFEDVTSNTNDGTANSLSVVNQVPGQIEGSLEFDDTLERHVNVPDDPSLRLATNMTVSSWIRTIDGDRSAAVIVNKWQAGGNKNYWLGKLDAASLLFQVHNDTYLATAPLGPVLDGSWHHVVGVADASTGELRIYVDGTEQGNDPTYSGTSETGTSPPQIGKSTDVITQTWEGRIDEVRVSGTVRSAEWILTEHTNQNNPPGLYTVCRAATAVRLSSFTATGADGAVELVWETASELNNLGFHLYRSTSESGSYARITTSVVPGLGSSPAGARYSYRDTGLTNGVTYYYELEDIETTGVTERHGPVSAMPQAGSTTGEGETSERALITYGEPTSTSLHVVKRTRTGMVLELRTGGFYAEPAEDGSVHLKIPDFEELSEAGAPAMPVKRSWVEALAGRKVTLVAVTAQDVEAFTALRPTNAPLVELVGSETGAVRTARRERRRHRRAFRGEGLYPSEAARLVTVGFQGETKKALVELAPLRWDESTGELSLTRRIVGGCPGRC